LYATGEHFHLEEVMDDIDLNDGVDALACDAAGPSLLEERALRAERLDAIVRMGCSVAHDINNLLTVILGRAELMAEEIPGARPEAAEVRDAAASAAALIRKFVTFARCGVLARPELVNVHETASGLLGVLKQLAGKSVVVLSHWRAEDPVVLIERSGLEQVLINLVVNGRDAMPRGGVMTISTRTHGRHVLIEVEDTGSGIAPEVRARVFDRFFTTKGSGKGTGLGLSTVADIVKRAGGHIKVDSVVGQGTTFRVQLPVTRRGAQRIAEVGR
jgi:signal transduction histidine kinase